VANLENKSIRRFDTPHWIIHLDFIEDVLNLTMGEGGLISVDLSNPAPRCSRTGLILSFHGND